MVQLFHIGGLHARFYQRTLVVPSAAIQSGIQGAFVWVVDGPAGGSGTARIQPVKVALAEGQFTILDSGLQPGQNVVIDGADRLRPGQAVTTTTTRTQPPQAAASPTIQAPGQAKP